MARATVSEIRDHTDEYLELVRWGGKVTIVEAGTVVAELVPTDEARRTLQEVIRRASDDDAKVLSPLLTDEHTPHSRLRHVINVLRRTSETFEAIRTSLREALPKDFFTRARPTFASGSVLDALLEERRNSRW